MIKWKKVLWVRRVARIWHQKVCTNPSSNPEINRWPGKICHRWENPRCGVNYCGSEQDAETDRCQYIRVACNSRKSTCSCEMLLIFNISIRCWLFVASHKTSHTVEIRTKKVTMDFKDFSVLEGSLTVHRPSEIIWNANLMQRCNFIRVFLSRHVSGTYARHQEH